MGRCGRNWAKKKAGWFKKGSASWNSGKTFGSSQTGKTETKHLTRLTKQTFQRSFMLNAQGEWTPRAAEFIGFQGDAPGAVLRPQSDELSQIETILQQKQEDESVSGYLVVHLSTCLNVVQDCVNEHGLASPKCKGRLRIPANLFSKWGVSAIIQLKCDSCEYISQKQKLYMEVPTSGRGRRSAQPNRSLALGLCNSSIATVGCHRTLSCMNIPVPTASSLQKQLNNVGPTLSALNEEDMCNQRRQLKDILEHGGYHRDTPIPAECDRQYNTGLRSSRRRTPCAPATQTRDVVAEGLTPEKKIIAFNHESKLCKVGESSRLRGVQLTCPGHDGCTATLKTTDNAGDERQGGRKLAVKLSSGAELISVDKLTTDADGRMAEGFSEVMMAKQGVKTNHYLDTVHLNRSVAAAISRAHIKPQLKTSVPCKYKDREQAINRLADSMAFRAEREVRAANDRFGMRRDLAVETVSSAIPAMIRCYEGDHYLCKKYSLVCNGEHLLYEYLPKFARGTFRFSREDAKSLVTILRKRMGREAMAKTRYGFTTQKVESVNHAFVTTNPKHSMTFSRNGMHRDHSAIHMLNNPVGDSIFIKARACGVPLSANSPCLSILHHMNKRQVYFSLRARTSASRKRRAVLRRKRYELYDNIRNERFYVKGQLDPK